MSPVGLAPVSPITVAPLEATPRPAPPSGVPFADLLGGAVDAANQRATAAEGAASAFASGAADDIHGTMIAMKEADVSVHLAATVRNKLVDAFYELWRMSV